MSVYLLHLNAPLAHARHYVGFARDVDRRLAHHRAGSGARMLAVAVERGIGFELARVWPDGDKSFERKLKNCKHAARYCPACAGAAAREYVPRGGR